MKVLVIGCGRTGLLIVKSSVESPRALDSGPFLWDERSEARMRLALLLSHPLHDTEQWFGKERELIPSFPSDVRSYEGQHLSLGWKRRPCAKVVGVWG